MARLTSRINGKEGFYALLSAYRAGLRLVCAAAAAFAVGGGAVYLADTLFGAAGESWQITGELLKIAAVFVPAAVIYALAVVVHVLLKLRRLRRTNPYFFADLTLCAEGETLTMQAQGLPDEVVRLEDVTVRFADKRYLILRPDPYREIVIKLTEENRAQAMEIPELAKQQKYEKYRQSL